MTLRRASLIAAFTAVAALLAWVMFIGLPRWYCQPAPATVAPTAAAPAESGRKIKARLFYVTEAGTRLTAVEREVPYAEQTVDQAREIITAQIAPVTEPLVSAIPPSTELRALFVTEHGEAFVDLSGRRRMVFHAWVGAEVGNPFPRRAYLADLSLGPVPSMAQVPIGG